MRQRAFVCLLVVEAGLLFALTVLTDLLPDVFSSLLAFPFEQIGQALGVLSRQGRVCNGLALMLLVAISALPLAAALRHIRERQCCGENATLAVTAVVLAAVLFQMAKLPVSSEEQVMQPVLKAVMGGAVWSLLVCWAVLRLLRLFQSGAAAQLYAYLRTLLKGLCILLTGAVVLSCGELITALKELQRPLDGLMAVLRFAVGVLPYGGDIAVTFAAMTLLDRLLGGERTQAVQQAGRFSRLCCRMLGWVTGSVAGLNLLQLVLARQISDISLSVNIPLLSLAFVLGALLLSRLIAENSRLSDENELFI